jgi:kumamolisin
MRPHRFAFRLWPQPASRFLIFFALWSLLLPVPPTKADVVTLSHQPLSAQSLRVTLVLAGRDESGAYRAAAAVSDPQSPSYRRPMTRADWVRRFGPDPAAVRALIRGLQVQGLRPEPWDGGTLLHVDGTPGVVAATFGKATGAAPLHVPARFSGLVRGVLGGTGGTGQSAASAAWHGAATLVPAAPAAYAIGQITSAYDFGPLYAAGIHGENTRVALVELAPYDRADISSFTARLGHELTLHDHQVDAGNTKAPANVEATVDIELLTGTAPAASIDVWNAPPDSDGQGLIDAYGEVAGDPTIDVLGLTWVTCEADAAHIPGFLAAEHLLFAQMTAQGTTIVGATGDSGAYGCADPGQSPRAAANTQPAVSVPASDPFVLGVGATDLSLKGAAASARILSESSWSCLAAQHGACAATSALGAGTGGGLSRIYSKKTDDLTWQTGPGVRNRQSTGGRQVPDIAASGSSGLGNGHGYAIFYHGAWTVGGGTSAAMPIWAGLAVLADQYVVRQGGSPLAWINPLIYHLANTAQAHPAYHDVLKGGNLLYRAGPGWVYASGWGSPDAWNFVRDAASYAARST